MGLNNGQPTARLNLSQCDMTGKRGKEEFFVYSFLFCGWMSRYFGQEVLQGMYVYIDQSDQFARTTVI